MSLYLVTGGSGFIGSNLVHALVARGERVRILDNLSTGREVNIAPLLADAERRHQVDFLRGDLTDPDVMQRALRDVDYVLHQAALPSVPRSIERPLDTDRVNVFGTLQLLELARRAGSVKRVVFASSSSVYGERHPDDSKVETMTPMPLSPYAVSKLTGEHYLAVYSRLHGLPTVALRYFNVFGPRQDPNGPYAAVIPKWMALLFAGQPVELNGDGTTSRDFCFVLNAVQANLRAALAPGNDVSDTVYNVAVGSRTSLAQLYVFIRSKVAKTRPEVARIEPTFLPFRAGDIKDSQADISLARERLGYSPTHTIEEGLELTVVPRS